MDALHRIKQRSVQARSETVAQQLKAVQMNFMVEVDLRTRLEWFSPLTIQNQF